jgi:hypothetical protein
VRRLSRGESWVLWKGGGDVVTAGAEEEEEEEEEEEDDKECLEVEVEVGAERRRRLGSTEVASEA